MLEMICEILIFFSVSDSLRHLWVSDLLPEVKLRKLHEVC